MKVNVDEHFQFSQCYETLDMHFMQQVASQKKENSKFFQGKFSAEFSNSPLQRAALFSPLTPKKALGMPFKMAQLKKFIFVVLHSLSLFLSLSTQLELEWDVDEEEN